MLNHAEQGEDGVEADVLAEYLQVLVFLQQNLDHLEELDALLDGGVFDKFEANLQEADPVGVKDRLAEASSSQTDDFLVDA